MSVSKARSILLKYWGFNDFRPMQEDVIHSVINGNDTLALLPTGGGKSICFQVPTMVQEGICIVVSPLIALMQDQVENLKQKGIKAICIFSGMSAREIDIALDNAVYGDCKFLYVSPERLSTELFKARVVKMKVNLIAIDESHCISQWGYDFRPSYLNIVELRELLPEIPVLALTATATPKVVEDIQSKLHFKQKHVLQKSFERNNLAYLVRYDENKFDRLLKIINNVKGTGIVYVRNRKKTVEIARFLTTQGISASHYHAGMSHVDRESAQGLWKNGTSRVIVATNAFGMGIDKPDVRFVIHMEPPDTLEAYFQEAGRAGRDEQSAFAILMYENADLLEKEKNIESQFPPSKEIKRIYNALGNYYKIPVGGGEARSFPFDMSTFCSNFNLQPLSVLNSIKLMEREGWLSFNEGFHQPSRVTVNLEGHELYDFQVRNPSYDIFIKTILRSYSGLFDNFVSIREHVIAQKMKISMQEVKSKLKALNKMSVVSYEEQSDAPRITFIMARLANDRLFLSPEHYAHRKKEALEKWKAVRHYIESDETCRSILLLDYFGEHKEQRCGICDVCRETNKMDISEFEFEKMSSAILNVADHKTISILDLGSNFEEFNENKLMKVCRYLIDQDKISLEGDVLKVKKK